MRAFLGLSPDASTKLAIEAWRNKALPCFSSPVPAANFHVTLAFLGQVNTKQLDKLTSQIDATINSRAQPKAFPVNLDFMGYWAKPKACWLGSEHTHSSHQQLVSQLQRIAKSSGLIISKQEYIAHLTLARKCAIEPPAPLIPPQFGWQAKAFHLFESVSSAHGVSYHIRQSWPLDMTFSFQQ
ncbi:RNA 2',3'-cyclic phosphodiesterase [Paraglaciecola aquimarina]|uniref:RNA 2',3'-cyclic phosphodiesterase n=1 Tax=Paraglaciecola aquimarina TaxID=1235557 RepID=A0ABU3SSB5_9ALTE|nr:RNA 2',3'-cyclic phosphodiesterase [Paraglaciecola aquimarina]MDU0352906.1 RNA 2',3'-cyclic phosphodiesterase [Paraglaciecola aquimarina]